MILDLRHDPEVHAIYIKLAEKPYAYSQELDDDRMLDYAPDNSLRGVELLNVDLGVRLQGLPHAEMIAQALRDRDIQVR